MNGKQRWCLRESEKCVKYLVTLLQEGQFFLLRCIGYSQHVTKRHVFKALCLSDVIVYIQTNKQTNKLNAVIKLDSAV